MKKLFLFLLFSTPVFCQPAWLAVGYPFQSSSSSQLSSSSYEQQRSRVVYRKDTVKVYDTVNVVRVDTIRDTVYYWNSQYKYIVRYALTSLNVDITNPEWLDYASVNEIVARDTATLRIGSEEIRTLGNLIDQFGNKIPQTDIITTGFTIQIFKDRAIIEYRGKNSLAMFSGNFDSAGFLFATGEITETGFLSSFFPFSLFFGSSKKRIIIEIMREVY
jgi:hypothetical protein